MSNGGNVSDQQMSWWWSWKKRKCLSSGGGLKAMADAFCSLIYGPTNDACWFWRLLACTNTIFFFRVLVRDYGHSWSTVHFISCSSTFWRSTWSSLSFYLKFVFFSSQWECRGVRSDTRDSIYSNFIPVFGYFIFGWWTLSPYKACGQLCGFLPIGYWFIVFIFNRMMDLLHLGVVWFFQMNDFPHRLANRHLPSTEVQTMIGKEKIFRRKRNANRILCFCPPTLPLA